MQYSFDPEGVSLTRDDVAHAMFAVSRCSQHVEIESMLVHKYPVMQPDETLFMPMHGGGEIVVSALAIAGSMQAFDETAAGEKAKIANMLAEYGESAKVQTAEVPDSAEASGKAKARGRWLPALGKIGLAHS